MQGFRASSRRPSTVVAALGLTATIGLGLTGCGSSGSNTGAKATGGSTTAAASPSTAKPGTGTQTSVELPTFKINAEMPYKFSLPKSEAPSGFVRVELTNNDKQMAHHAQLIELRKGVTFETFKADVMGPIGEGAFFKDGSVAGGPNAVGPNMTSSAIVDLKPGATYAVVCTLPAPDGKSHTSHGMIASFTVSDDPGVTEAPEASSSVELVDFGFKGVEAVDWIKPVEVKNTGTEPHELVILGAAKGKTLDDVRKALSAPNGSASGPPPYVSFGGITAIAPGASQVFTPDVPKGDYLLICFVPDTKKNMMPHFVEGMIQPFTVS